MSAPAVIYARISKDDNDDRLGVGRQENLCRALADAEGLDVVSVIVDNDVSAYHRRRRPGFEQLVKMLEAGQVSSVVTYHADRLYRRTVDLERLVDVVEGTGAQVRTVAAGNIDLNTASGRMVARMLGAAAQGESERMGERIKAKGDELAATGRPPGGRPPFGYSAGYIVNPDEAEAVRFMAHRVLEGSSLLGLARELDARGTTTREGRPWHHSSVRATLKNPAVAGLRVLRREIAGPGTWEPVLDRDEWEKVQAVLSDPARKHKRPATRYLLTGLLETPTGDPMSGRPDRGPGNGRSNRRCYATRSPAVTSASIGADDLEELIVATMLELLDKAPIPEPAAAPEADTEIAAIDRELEELATIRGEGTISQAEWLAARTPLLERLNAAKAAAGTTKRLPATVLALSKPGAVRRAWPTLDFAARREILRVAIEKVVVGPATRKRWTPVSDRLMAENGGGILWNL